MYNMVIIVNNTVLYTWKLLREILNDLTTHTHIHTHTHTHTHTYTHTHTHTHIHLPPAPPNGPPVCLPQFCICSGKLGHQEPLGLSFRALCSLMWHPLSSESFKTQKQSFRGKTQKLLHRGGATGSPKSYWIASFHRPSLSWCFLSLPVSRWPLRCGRLWRGHGRPHGPSDSSAWGTPQGAVQGLRYRSTQCCSSPLFYFQVVSFIKGFRQSFLAPRKTDSKVVHQI